MSKNFFEVIRDIKLGETWTCESEKITMPKRGVIDFTWEEGYIPNRINLEERYSLEAVRFSFDEAMTLLEVGKTIESCEYVDGHRYKYRKKDGKYQYSVVDREFWQELELVGIRMNEIKGEWEVNN